MIKVLVTGANGQLANNIKDISNAFPSLALTYKTATQLDITDILKVKSILEENKYHYVINCAAYTNVDKAEEEKDKAFDINQLGVKNIAEVCVEKNIVLIHISTDFIFEGNTSIAYKETDLPNPKGVYGLSKLKGEQEINKIVDNYFIIRTSWLYSEHNKNFMKTMINLSKFKDELQIIDDQIGTPTYAKDLAKIILQIINKKSKAYGVYHYANEGVASWFDFAKAIFAIIKSDINLMPIKTKDYFSAAERPYFSVLDKTKIKDKMKIEIPYWRDSLEKAIKNL